MSKFVVFSVLIVLMSMYQPIHSYGVGVQQDPAIYNAIGTAISSKIQSINSIISSLLTLKSSYKTVNINSYGTSSGSSSTSSSSSSGGSTSNNVVYSTLPIYKKVVNVNYASSAPVANTIEDSSNDVASTSDSPSSVGTVGQTIFVATKVIGGVPAAAPATTSATTSAPAAVDSSDSDSTSSSSSDSDSVASPNTVTGYSYTKIVG